MHAHLPPVERSIESGLAFGKRNIRMRRRFRWFRSFIRFRSLDLLRCFHFCFWFFWLFRSWIFFSGCWRWCWTPLLNLQHGVLREFSIVAPPDCSQFNARPVKKLQKDHDDGIGRGSEAGNAWNLYEKLQFRPERPLER